MSAVIYAEKIYKSFGDHKILKITPSRLKKVNLFSLKASQDVESLRC